MVIGLSLIFCIEFVAGMGVDMRARVCGHELATSCSKTLLGKEVYLGFPKPGFNVQR